MLHVPFMDNLILQTVVSVHMILCHFEFEKNCISVHLKIYRHVESIQCITNAGFGGQPFTSHLRDWLVTTLLCRGTVGHSKEEELMQGIKEDYHGHNHLGCGH